MLRVRRWPAAFAIPEPNRLTEQPPTSIARCASSKVELRNGRGCEEAPGDRLRLAFNKGAQRSARSTHSPCARPMGSPSPKLKNGRPAPYLSRSQSGPVLVMDLEALKLKLLYCLERAEEADRDDVVVGCRYLAAGRRIQDKAPTPHGRMGHPKERR
jgi:hypothetical protein